MQALTFEKPYYAVIFTSKRTEIDDGYDEVADKTESVVGSIPGFLGMESWRDADGEGVTISYWKSMEAIEQWKHHALHVAAKKMGAEKWYAAYHIRICKVESDHAFVQCPKYVFVYGTLLSNYGKMKELAIEKHVKLYGQATLQAAMYDMGDYPGIVESSKDTVKGELYELLDDAALDVLDAYEGYVEADVEHSEYIRRIVTVESVGGQPMKVWAYYYNRPVPPDKHVSSGWWTMHVLERRSKNF